MNRLFVLPSLNLGACHTTPLLLQFSTAEGQSDVSRNTLSTTVFNGSWVFSLPEFMVTPGIIFLIDSSLAHYFHCIPPPRYGQRHSTPLWLSFAFGRTVDFEHVFFSGLVRDSLSHSGPPGYTAGDSCPDVPLSVELAAFDLVGDNEAVPSCWIDISDAGQTCISSMIRSTESAIQISALARNFGSKYLWYQLPPHCSEINWRHVGNVYSGNL